MTTARISLTAVAHNLRVIRARTDEMGGGGIIPVVKADAYGHGVGGTTATLDPFAALYAVASPDEARTLRAYTEKPILVLGYTPPEMLSLLYKLRIIPCLFAPEQLLQVERAGLLMQRRGERSTPISVHIAIDTGMHRVGLTPSKETCALLGQVAMRGVLRIRGIYSHLYAPTDEGEVTRQMRLLRRVTDHFPNAVTHLASGAAALRYGACGFDAVRPGLAMWGYGGDGLIPALSLSSNVVCTRFVGVGDGAGYDLAFRPSRGVTVAVVPFGYADGALRALSGLEVTLVEQGLDRAHRARIVGRISMDSMLVAAEDDYVPMVGDAVRFPSAIVAASHAGTIPYELLARIGSRVKRVYVNDPLPIGEQNCSS